MKKSVDSYWEVKRSNQRAAKERKRLASPRSEMDEELRWLHNNPRKTKRGVNRVFV